MGCRQEGVDAAPAGANAVVCAPFSVATLASRFIVRVSITSMTPGSPTAT
jgi:hypothetical protein